MRVTKTLKSFLIAAAICGTMSAATHSKRTFLMPRPQGNNLAMELSLYHDYIFDVNNKFKNTIQATPFYQAGIKGEKVGKYFGIGNGKNNFKIGHAGGTGVEVTNRYFVHNYDPTLAANPIPDVLAGTMVFIQWAHVLALSSPLFCLRISACATPRQARARIMGSSVLIQASNSFSRPDFPRTLAIISAA